MSGISSNLKGFKYFREAIILGIQKNGTYFITMNIYPSVAMLFNTSSTSVERSMRSAIDSAWNKGCNKELYENFGNTIDNRKCKPTNTQFFC